MSARIDLDELAECRHIVAHSRPSSMESADLDETVAALIRAVKAALASEQASGEDGWFDAQSELRDALEPFREDGQ